MPEFLRQHHVCDIGLEGAVVTIDGVKKEAFQVFLGGASEFRNRSAGASACVVPSDDLGPRSGRLLTFFKDTRNADESFQAFCGRHSNEELGHHLTTALAVASPVMNREWPVTSGP
jgi:sulfite reductase beta subunit-like hemoprotein